MKKLKLAILKNEMAQDHLFWLKACEKLQHLVDWEVIELTRADWLEQIYPAESGLRKTPIARQYEI